MGNQVDGRLIAASPPPKLVRLLWGVFATFACVIYTLVLTPLAAIIAPFSHHSISWIGRLWARLIIRTCGVKVEIEGLENLRGLAPFILVGNHQSFFDIFAVLAYMPAEIRFVAKRELLRIPLFGLALRRSKNIAIGRRTGGQAIRSALEAVRLGYSICVFAEGRRYNDNRVHDFNDGAAWLAIAVQRPCVPMAVSGSGGFFPRGAIIVMPRGRMRMTICAPIATEGLKGADRTDLTHRLELAVRSAFLPKP